MPTAISPRRNPALSPRQQLQPWDTRTVGPACIPPAQRLAPSERSLQLAQAQHRALAASQMAVDTALHHADVLYTQVLENAPGASGTAWLSRFYAAPNEAGVCGTSITSGGRASKQTTGEATTAPMQASPKRNGVGASPRRRLCSPRHGTLSESTFAGCSSMMTTDTPRRGRQQQKLHDGGHAVGGGSSNGGSSTDFSPADYPQKMNWSNFSFEVEARRRARLPSVAAHTGVDVGLDVGVATSRTPRSTSTTVPLPPIARCNYGSSTAALPHDHRGSRSSPLGQMTDVRDLEGGAELGAVLEEGAQSSSAPLFVSDAAFGATALDDVCDDIDYRCETYLRENVNDDVWCFNVADEASLVQVFRDTMQPSELAALLRREAQLLGAGEALRTPKETSLATSGRNKRPSLEVHRRSSCFQDASEVPQADTWLCVERSRQGQGTSYLRKTLHRIRSALQAALAHRNSRRATATTAITTTTTTTAEVSPPETAVQVTPAVNDVAEPQCLDDGDWVQNSS